LLDDFLAFGANMHHHTIASRLIVRKKAFDSMSREKDRFIAIAMSNGIISMSREKDRFIATSNDLCVF